MNKRKRWMALLACSLLLAGCKGASKADEGSAIGRTEENTVEQIETQEPESQSASSQQNKEDEEDAADSSPVLVQIDEENAAAGKAEAVDWKSVYTQALRDELQTGYVPSGEEEWNPLWYLWEDAGQDVPILVTMSGSSEAEKVLKFYQATANGARRLGETGAGQSSYYCGDDAGSYIRVWMHHGAEAVYMGTVDFETPDVSENMISQTEFISEPTVPSTTEWTFQNRYAWPYGSLE